MIKVDSISKEIKSVLVRFGQYKLNPTYSTVEFRLCLLFFSENIRRRVSRRVQGNFQRVSGILTQKLRKLDTNVFGTIAKCREVKISLNGARDGKRYLEKMSNIVSLQHLFNSFSFASLLCPERLLELALNCILEDMQSLVGESLELQ